MRQKFLLTIFIITSFYYTHAQNDATTNSRVKFKIGVSYNSSLNYFGRTDCLRSKQAKILFIHRAA